MRCDYRREDRRVPLKRRVTRKFGSESACASPVPPLRVLARVLCHRFQFSIWTEQAPDAAREGRGFSGRPAAAQGGKLGGLQVFGGQIRFSKRSFPVLRSVIE